ncbi:MAG: ATP synthase F1 subunit epsilon [Pirellulales bacterium]|jgi:F-type H+-transporting ATPase subunit epsilon
MPSLKCIVVTPEETALETEAEFVALPLFDGEIGIFPNHSPMIGRLGYGEMRIISGGQTKRYYVDGGFVQVDDNEINVLTGKAVEASTLDGNTAEEQLAEAQKKPVTTDDLLATREKLVDQARAQIRVANKPGS